VTHYRVPLPVLHADQRKVLALPGKRKLVRCGRRWGKTDLGKTVAVSDAAKGFPVGWFAPDYKISSEAYDEMLDVVESSRPNLKRSSSRAEGRIKTRTRGRIDVWTLENERAGRSRKYKRAIIDEGAFTKPGPVTVPGSMLGIWDKSIEPTLLDLDGDALVLSNTNGNDPENFLYAISPAGGDPPVGGYDPSKPWQPGKNYGFVEHHAPSWMNPHVPARKSGETREEWLVRRALTFEKLRAEKHPLVFAQEYGAEFVDWSGVAFFEKEKLLLRGAPAPYPNNCDAVFAVIDSATKTGKANDGTGVAYYAINKANKLAPLVVLDWDLVQIEGDLLINWLPGVIKRLEVLAAIVGARAGSLGAFVEDKDSGQILLQAAARKPFAKFVHAIESKLTAIGKDERAMKASGHVYPGKVKFSLTAYEKVTAFKDVTRNHMLAQVLGFRIGDKDAAKRADDLLDCFTYGVCIALGDADGL
jgi:hypothetical protein